MRPLKNMYLVLGRSCVVQALLLWIVVMRPLKNMYLVLGRSCVVSITEGSWRIVSEAYLDVAGQASWEKEETRTDYEGYCTSGLEA